ncbi:MAG: ATP-binding cassette domain-containing protein, partial [Planctomycetes bacterium]|nr:ATP-binding cassette domain-containing protein [Planctomycetota bacterium]
MIEVQDIVKRYGATVAVNHVSFRVGKGEILGFLGPNGAGKSTTLKILTCYIVADSGKVSVNGRDVLEDSLGVRRSVGYLPESTAFYADMRVGDYLRFVAKARQVDPARIREAVDRVVGMVQIERMLKKNVGHLSKGYRQRVGLAQALIHDPPILVLDEPTSGLDPHQIIEIRELLREIGKTKVIVFSSHILQEISAM